MKKFSLIILLISILFILYIKNNFLILNINDENYIIEISNTKTEQERGLSGRKGLCEKCGMIFVYEKERVSKFWMKEMNFSLDIIWLDKDKKIVHIEDNLKPETFPESFGPEEKTVYTLEFNDNFVEDNNIKIGKTIDF